MAVVSAAAHDLAKVVGRVQISSATPLQAPVAERQTRCAQAAVSARAWEFKSPLGHVGRLAETGKAPGC